MIFLMGRVSLGSTLMADLSIIFNIKICDSKLGIYKTSRLIMPLTPLRKAALYEPRIAILGIWGDTWLTRGKYGIYVEITGPLRGLRDAFCHVKISPIYCRVSYVAVVICGTTW